MLTYYFIPIKLLGHLLWVAKKVAEKENLNESGYRIGKNTDLFNPFTPRSVQDLNSPYNCNTLSSRQVMRIKKIINYGYCLDMTPNSQNWLTKKCIVISWENWFSDLGSERVKFVKYSGTFHLGHLLSGDTTFGPGTEKCWYKLCIYYMAGSMSGKDEANPVF